MLAIICWQDFCKHLYNLILCVDIIHWNKTSLNLKTFDHVILYINVFCHMVEFCIMDKFGSTFGYPPSTSLVFYVKIMCHVKIIIATILNLNCKTYNNMLCFYCRTNNTLLLHTYLRYWSIVEKMKVVAMRFYIIQVTSIICVCKSSKCVVMFIFGTSIEMSSCTLGTKRLCLFMRLSILPIAFEYSFAWWGNHEGQF